MSNLTQNTTSLQGILAAVNALPTKVDTSGTAVAADIYKDKTATVNDVMLTGTNPYNATNVGAALADSFAALTEKGVTVPSGADVGDLAQLIAAIESGGGGVEIIKFTPAENVTKPVISHSLGSVPEAAIIIAESDPNEVTMVSDSIVYGFTKGDYHNRAPYYNTSRLSSWSHMVIKNFGITSNITGTVSGVVFCNATNESIKVLNSADDLTGGVTYTIILFAQGVWK